MGERPNYAERYMARLVEQYDHELRAILVTAQGREALTALLTGDGPREAARAAVVAVVDDHLNFNVAAYGKAWTGEGEDTEFIVADSAQKALAAAVDALDSPEGDA